MTTIEISDELAAAVRTMAAAEGLTPDSWLKKLIAKSTNAESEEEERLKLEWLRAATKEGLDAIERGEYTELNSPGEIDNLMDAIYEEVKENLAAGRRVG